MCILLFVHHRVVKKQEDPQKGINRIRIQQTAVKFWCVFSVTSSIEGYDTFPKFCRSDSKHGRTKRPPNERNQVEKR